VRGRKDLGHELYEALEAKAKSDNLRAALFGVTLLGRIPNRGQIDVLEEVAGRASDKILRCQAMYSMGLLRDPAGVPFLLRVLGSPKEGDYERQTAASAVEIIRDGITDKMPVEVWWYVFDREPGGIMDFPTLAAMHADLSAWWQANAERLLSQRQVLDYRNHRSKPR